MDRISLGGGQWFDRDRVQKTYDESQQFDGRNFISNATGSQWEHQELLLTAGGAWILHEWSQWQGSRPTYSEITAEEAARWILCHGGADDLPAELAEFAGAGER